MQICKCGLFWESSSSKSAPSSHYNISSTLHIATFSTKDFQLKWKCIFWKRMTGHFFPKPTISIFCRQQIEALESSEAASQKALIHFSSLDLTNSVAQDHSIIWHEFEVLPDEIRMWKLFGVFFRALPKLARLPPTDSGNLVIFFPNVNVWQ